VTLFSASRRTAPFEARLAPAPVDDVVITAAVTGSGAGSASRRARRAPRAAADVVIVHPTAALSAPRARSAVLRLTTPLTLALGGLPSAVVHLKDVNRDRGFALMQHLTPTLAPNWRAFLGGGLLHSTMHQLALPGAVGDDARRLRGIGRFVLRAAAEAVLAAGAGAAGERRDAADELLAPQRFLPISALAYSATNGTLHDHVDGTGRYLVLLSLGCTVNFLVDGRVVSFESGDALVFNGGRYHDVMHGVRNVQPGTCPAGLPRELRDARVSLQLRQM
jgi:hypothetical protein